MLIPLDRNRCNPFAKLSGAFGRYRQPTQENLKRIRNTVDSIEQFKPSAEVLKSIESSREVIEKALKNSSLYQLQKAMEDIPSNRLKNAIDNLPAHQLTQKFVLDKDAHRAIAKAARQLTNIRNNLAHHGGENRRDLSGPAYSLEGDDDA